ncbi:hypothetical protein KR038_007490, partial [Drosophila bunnanda]
RLDFTNINCTSLDKTFSDFGYCYLKAENRTYKHLSLRVHLYQTPVKQFKVNIALYKRSNGLSPISYNLTVDGCKMISGHKSPWVKFLFGLFREHSNINHSCPFNHDIIVDKLPADFLLQKFTSFLPFPEGDYVFSSNWIAYGINRANVRVHVSYT